MMTVAAHCAGETLRPLHRKCFISNPQHCFNNSLISIILLNNMVSISSIINFLFYEMVQCLYTDTLL